MSTLREAAQAVVEQFDPELWGTTDDDRDRAIDRLRAALAQPETEAEPVAWMHHTQVGDGGDGRTLSFSPDYYPSRASRGIGVVRETIAVVPLYAHPPRDEWREAVHDELVTTWTLSAENKDDPRLALRDVINWHVRVSLDPAVSSDAQALIDQGRAMRDVQPPTEGTAKCQRIEGSGEICGLTPPCPDCGASLIDVAEGA